MLSSLAANAVLAKSRAKFGNRLTEQNYSDLLACRSVPEIANYLKNRTVYADCLEGYSPENLHRGLLEVCLRHHLFAEYESLYKYELSLGEKFNKYFIYKSENEQISKCLRLITAGKSDYEYIFEMPEFFSRHSSLNMEKMSQARTLKELIDALSGTPYYKILEPFVKMDDLNIDFAVLDAALQKFTFAEIKNAVENNFRGTTKKDLLKMLGSRSDIENLSYIYRLKYIFRASNDYILPMLIPMGTLLSKKEIAYLLDDNSKEDFFERVSKTPLQKYFLFSESEYVEIKFNMALFTICTKNMRYSSIPPVVLFSFLMLAEIEIMNIIHIIEGIRYQVPPEEISKLLVGIKS